MIVLIFLLLQVPDTTTVAVLTEPPVAHVSIFSDNQVSEIIQGAITLISLLITGWVSLQIAKVKTQIIAVHKEINSINTQALITKHALGVEEGKAEEKRNQKEREK